MMFIARLNTASLGSKAFWRIVIWTHRHVYSGNTISQHFTGEKNKILERIYKTKYLEGGKH
jgi:hypothetical protein